MRGRSTGLLLAGLAALLLAAWAIWGVFVRPGQQAGAAAQARGDAVVAAGEAAKAADAIPVIEKHYSEKERIERVTIAGNAAILAAPGAADRIPADVDRAARAALCLHQIYHGHPACQQLPQPDSRGGAGGDPAG